MNHLTAIVRWAVHKGLKMCWTPELVEFPTRWTEKGQEGFDELGIEPELRKGTVCLDVKSVNRMNESDHSGCTTLEISGGMLWTVDIPYEQVKEILRKFGVSVSKASEILNEKDSK